MDKATGTARYETRGEVALITLDNPPVNGMSYAVRMAALEGLDRALADGKVKAIVLTGAGKAFSGGADIREFNTPAMLAEPTLRTLITAFEQSSKPVIAAMHTVAMAAMTTSGVRNAVRPLDWSCFMASSYPAGLRAWTALEEC